MEKVSQEQLQQILAEVPGTLRKIAADRDMWREKALAYEQHDAISKVAHAMQEKGINSEMSDEEIYDMLKSAAANGKLDQIAMSVDFVAPDMSQKIAQLSDSTSGGGANRFEASILGSNG